MLGSCEVCGKSCVGKDGKKYKRCFDHKETSVPQPVQKQVFDEYPQQESRENYWQNKSKEDVKKNAQITRQAVLNTAVAIQTLNNQKSTAKEIIKIAEELEVWVKAAN